MSRSDVTGNTNRAAPASLGTGRERSPRGDSPRGRAGGFGASRGLTAGARSGLDPSVAVRSIGHSVAPPMSGIRRNGWWRGLSACIVRGALICPCPRRRGYSAARDAVFLSHSLRLLRLAPTVGGNPSGPPLAVAQGAHPSPGRVAVGRAGVPSSAEWSTAERDIGRNVEGPVPGPRHPATRTAASSDSRGGVTAGRRHPARWPCRRRTGRGRGGPGSGPSGRRRGHRSSSPRS
jgi:hypothetical protein